jgi:hypothetical protein
VSFAQHHQLLHHHNQQQHLYSHQQQSFNTHCNQSHGVEGSCKHYPDETGGGEEGVDNPPMSPTSIPSSGGTQSISAAVSNESVGGDSGVYEASVKRY